MGFPFIILNVCLLRAKQPPPLLILHRVVAKLEKRPNRAAPLGRWIRALLSCHLGYLVSVPGLPDKLALLHQLIDRRVASFPKLLQLHGRLDLLLARAKAEGVHRGTEGRAMDKPESVYREEDEEDEEEDEDEDEEDEDEGDEESEGQRCSMSRKAKFSTVFVVGRWLELCVCLCVHFLFLRFRFVMAHWHGCWAFGTLISDEVVMASPPKTQK